ncbi:hypothetical protein ACJ6WF_41625 [Streptomyces sp. MMS24-I2-30]|uniref:hypothetical protein n=1 Tax=Streptomyces sp. MMS24-I2-30 TaxID=3351564 RepID=UPI003896AAD2
MENFYARVGRFWPAGRRDLHWHILPTPQEARALAAPYKGFARPGLPGVPEQWMHCTLLHAVDLGRGDVHTDALIADAAEYARTARPFTLTFDRPSIGVMAVEISGWPRQPFAAIVTTGEVLGEGRPNRNGASFLAFMKKAVTPHAGKEIHVVLDNLCPRIPPRT